jgi:hypothetical protein
VLPRNATLARLRLAFGAATGVLAVVVAVTASAGVDSTTHFVWITIGSVLATCLLAALVGMWTASAVYAAVFWCFHLGLVAAVASGYLPAIDLTLTDEGWIAGPFAGEAARLAFAGILAFASGASLMYARRSDAAGKRDRPPQRGEVVHPYGGVGSILVFAAIAAWCAVVLVAGGINGFFASYESFRDLMADYSVPIGIISPTLACGIVIAFTGRRGWHRNAAIVAFACFAVVALPIGLRTDVMFPVVAVTVAAARCGRRFSPLKAAAIGVGLLILIPVVRDVRTTGLKALPDAVMAPRLDAFVEMGGSLRPVEQVVSWHAEGESYLLGSSYWAPFERAAARLLPGVHPIAADDDLRLMNVLVLERIGAIGFSPVAEAYRNFGPVGMVVVMALFGIALAALDSIRDPRKAVLAIATLYTPLLVNIRNSFVAVPVQCAAGILLLLGLTALRHMVDSVMTRTYANPSYLRSQI